MDAVRVALLREVLAGTEWLGATGRFAGVLRASVSPPGSGGLLLVGTKAYEPWHLAAHLMDEAAWSGLPTLAPTLVRHEVGPHDPAHLSVGLGRLAAAGRGETLLVVSGPTGPDADLLERVNDVRRAGTTVLALSGSPSDTEIPSLAHELLSVPPDGEVDLDTAQHLVSAAAGENILRSTPGKGRLWRLLDGLLGPGPERW
ncbi:hypothetical protein GCM10010329_14390 [Streptomyces spiroverticillatus]|uniref:SIS domain-containing protein n=1 Tax=Streptomyces finlayi TaxID=67296 RepID=A0A919CCV6_9ACTN|nr:hypothetical protein [Streptomyces finlayi]GGZ94280.1 hypothetical protein GCM10010329_14390 [Streptomyces spiroverticillatus]GHD06688.1 hypothetical protein GCM10010334_58420 [Streptomyces finlayi]